MSGKVHNIGKRKEQQDSFGVSNVGNGRFAVVADGMGGLAEGDKVSQKIVLTMLQEAAKLSSVRAEDAPLYRMVSRANQEVTKMLGTGGAYKSGSTVAAVLAGPDSFQWISVGDSRIYLFRGNCLIQINREHIYETELLEKAVNGEISFSEVRTNRQRKGLTSFIGMGELKHVDGSLRPLEIMPRDKVLLMSDGVFHTLPETEICRILAETEDAQQAAAELEKQVLARQNPRQDNFTAVILYF
ncbi:protein phosphatase 2C domain-containing protein [Lachnospiraceae bacterium 45-W7]